MCDLKSIGINFYERSLSLIFFHFSPPSRCESRADSAGIGDDDNNGQRIFSKTKAKSMFGKEREEQESKSTTWCKSILKES